MRLSLLSSVNYIASLSVAYALQRDFQFKGEEEGKKRNKILPDDKVSRCRVTLNQQLMSEQSKPHTQSSNNPRALVPTWTFKKVQETKDWHVDKRNKRSLTDLLLRKRGWEFKENTRKKNYKKKTCLMRLPANPTRAYGISALQMRLCTL